MTARIVAAALFASIGASAQEPARPLVERLHVEPGAAVLRIEGRDLPRGVRVVLEGHGEELAVVRASDREIRALLPPALGFGSYALRLHFGPRVEDVQERRFETGPVGPAIDEKH